MSRRLQRRCLVGLHRWVRRHPRDERYEGDSDTEAGASHLTGDDLQVEMLRRRRSGDDDELTRRNIQLTIDGIATALRNSG